MSATPLNSRSALPRVFGALASLYLGLAGCSGEKGALGDGGTDGDVVASMSAPADEQTETLDPAAAELFDDENITFEPLDVPEGDFSAAPAESEPNDSAGAATLLGGDGAARGVAADKDEDFFKFVTEGEPQLWLIEVSGEGIERVEYVDRAGQARSAKRTEDEKYAIANLLLAPGTHWIRVRGKGPGAYTVRTVALGPPDRYVEREPNDDATRAHALTLGGTRTGLVFPESDRDLYRLSLFAEEHVVVRVDAPDDLALDVEFKDESAGSGGIRVRWRAREPGEPFEYEALLPPGDYLLRVGGGRGESRAPYRVRVERLEPWALSPDLEPNDAAERARPLPLDGVLEGQSGSGDEDWYRLPVPSVESRVTIRPDGEVRRMLALYGADERRTDLLSWGDSAGMARATLPAGAQTYLRVRVDGRYRLRVALDPPPAASPAAGPLPVDVRIRPSVNAFAAFLDRVQEKTVPVELVNRGDEPLDLTFTLNSGHEAWQLSLPERTLRLAPGARRELALRLRVAADAPAGLPVWASVAVSDSAGRTAGADLRLYARCDAEPVNPVRAGRLPEPLLGGMNVAASALGARPIAEESRLRRLAPLFDGLTPINGGWSESARELPLEVTVRLAGDAPQPTAGVLLHPLSNRLSTEWVREFDVLVSQDGRSFRQVYSGALSRRPVEQAFVFDSIVPARYARLRIRSTQVDGATYAALGEWKVIAAPSAPADSGFNIADPAQGGHVVWSTWRASYGTLETMLAADREGGRFRADPNLPNEWVVGFQHGRAAQIDRLEWIDRARPARQLNAVQVAVSRESPIGPWEPLGTWSLERGSDGVAPFRLDSLVWARFVRFSTSEPDRLADWDLPGTLGIIERATDAEYRSVVGEWGHYSREAIYELTWPEPAPQTLETAANDEPGSATRLEPGRPVAGVVTLGEDVDWYRVDVPDDANTVRLTLTGAPRLKATATLVDEAGNELPDVRRTVEPLETILEASVPGGARVYVRVEEPPRAIAFVWDNSTSVRPYSATIYQAMMRFSGEVKPGYEFANLLPFQDNGGSFLLETWSDQPHELQTALNDYHRQDGSSDAESSLLVAANRLAQWQGTRAVIFLTDAESPGYYRAPQLWAALAEAQPRIFTLHLHGAKAHEQDLMQDWAGVNGGHYEFFRTQGDLDTGFARAACLIRRPARYTISAETWNEAPPAPGTLTVEMTGAAPSAAVELILDASGSMLQRIEGKRRIAIARDVLTQLVRETLPAATPLAFRVFGHRKPGACDTELLVPPQPLDPERMAAIIGRTEAKNLAKTPIGESLRLVSEDLADVEGSKLVILITDGEETCGGDPAAAIRWLKDEGFDVRVNIVGFAIDDPALKAQFEEWARLGGGLYFDTADEAELAQALEDALRPKFQVLNAAGELVAEAITGGAPITLPVGTYSVRVLTSPARTMTDVVIGSERQTRLEVGGGG